MAIFKRKGKCGVKYGIDYSSNGRRVRKVISTYKYLAEVELGKTRLRLDKKAIGIFEPEKVLFETLGEKFLERSSALSAPNSHRRNECLVKVLSAHFHGRYISDITARDLETYIIKRLVMDKRKPATVNHEITCIKHMFNLAVEWKYIQENPFKSIKKLKEDNARICCLDDNEEQRLLRNCPSFLRPIIITVLYTGMRINEVLTLIWENVDLQNDIITISASNTKTKKTREIPILPEVHELLMQIEPGKGNKPVFSTRDGKHYPYTTIYDAFKRARKKSELDHVTIHDLRHTFASRLARKNVNMSILQEILGHSTIQMTMRYSHQWIESKRQAMMLISKKGNNCPKDGTNLAQKIESEKAPSDNF